MPIPPHAIPVAAAHIPSDFHGPKRWTSAAHATAAPITNSTLSSRITYRKSGLRWKVYRILRYSFIDSGAEETRHGLERTSQSRRAEDRHLPRSREGDRGDLRQDDPLRDGLAEHR